MRWRRKRDQNEASLRITLDDARLLARESSHGFVVAIIGIDGAGKTTLARNLQVELTKRGIHSSYIWGRFESSWLKVIVSMTRRIVPLYETEDGRISRTTLRTAIFNSFLLRVLYLYFMLISYAKRVGYSVRREMESGQLVLADRYYLDSIVDLHADIETVKDGAIKRLVRAFSTLFPDPSLIIFMELSPIEALSRKADIPSRSYVETRSVLYERLVELLTWKCVRVRGSEEDVLVQAIEAMGKSGLIENLGGT